MRSNNYKSVLAKSGLATALLVVSGAVFGQQQVNLTAAPSTAALPDGTAVPMWGYSCGTAVSGSTATCAKTNPAASGWSPVVITIPTGQDLQINLTNNLVFGANSVPTSLVIVGQLGGGLGAVGSRLHGRHDLHEQSRPYQRPAHHLADRRERSAGPGAAHRRRHSARTGHARAVTRHRSRARFDSAAHLDGPPPRYLPD